MKNILVPVDFSENSRNALNYAQELALYLEADIRVIHVMHPTVNTSYPYGTYNFEEEIAAKKTALASFVAQETDEEIKVLTKSKIKCEVCVGYAGDEITNQAVFGKNDLIVIGTTGAGGVVDRLLGSISSIVAQQSSCPVLLVPKDISFKDYINIMYASDFKSSNNALLKKIVNLSKSFEAKIHMVHVQPEQEAHDFEIEELIMDQMAMEKELKEDIKFVTIWDTNIWHGLNVYARDHQIDLMVFVKPQRKFWDKLLHKSVIKKMIKASPKPILILPAEK